MVMWWWLLGVLISMVASVLIVAGLLFVCGCIGVHDDSDSDDSVRGEGGDRVTCCAAHSFAIRVRRQLICILLSQLCC